MKYVPIGGQAVMEGVMMRHLNDYAVAVRKPDGEIEVKQDVYPSLVSRFGLRRIPILRGVCAFVDSMILGMKTLMYSAEFFEEDGEESQEPSRFQAWLTKRFGEKLDKFVMGFVVFLSIALAVGLFMVLPFFISNIFKGFIQSAVLLSIIEGCIRIALFLAYILLISRMKDIQRTFMYHGAEHKTINCIEQGLELTPENAMKCSRLHKRCGTSFLLIVMVVSIIFFIFIRIDSVALKVVARLLLVPVIAGVSYEVIQWAGRSQSKLVDIISKPGMWLQGLTTREPDAQMIEVAIASVEAIYDWRNFQEEIKS